MNRKSELEKADNELKELSTRIDGIKFHLKSLEANIALLNSLRIQFEQNIAFLKSERVIAALQEFKKIKEDLQTVNNRLYAMRIDLSNHNVMLDRAEKLLLERRENYVILLKEQDGRVIKGNFGGKK